MKAKEATNLWRKLKWRYFVVGFLVLTSAGLSFAFRSYVALSKQGANVPWKDLVLSYLIDFYLWGLASPFIFYLCHRFPVERERLLSRIAFYLLCGVGMTFTVVSVSIPVYWFLGNPDTVRNPTFPIFFFRSLMSPVLFQENYFIYVLTVFLAHSYEYYKQSREGKLAAAELSAQLAQAQLSALKMQLHPHFLFNTLNSIASLMRKDTEAAHRMIVRLSDFLRMTLKSSETHSVTLERELEFLNTYLEIEKIRFQDRLVVEMQIEPEAEEAQVPNLILQPLVENAVRHGLARVTSTGRLRITARRSNGRVKIEIEDNGPGFSANGKRKRAEAGGVGLSNTTARLEQFYAGDYQFEIKEKENERGTVVSLDFPFVASTN